MKKALEFEIKLANATTAREFRRDPNNLYNPTTLDQFENLPGKTLLSNTWSILNEVEIMKSLDLVIAISLHKIIRKQPLLCRISTLNEQIYCWHYQCTWCWHQAWGWRENHQRRPGVHEKVRWAYFQHRQYRCCQLPWLESLQVNDLCPYQRRKKTKRTIQQVPQYIAKLCTYL